MLKKILIISIILSALTVTACKKTDIETENKYFDEELGILTETTIDDFGYILNSDGDGIIITYKIVKAINVIIPDTIEDLPVIGFQSSLFNNDTIVRSVTLPVTVTAIPAFAFRYCSSLSSITMPGVITVGDQAFRDTNIGEITMPLVTTIGNEVFFESDSLTFADMPSIVTIGWNAFRNCVNLVKVNFGEELTTLGLSAFNGCRSLKDINVPESLTTFLLDRWDRIDHTFSGCHRLPLAIRAQLIERGYSGNGF